MTKAIDQRDFFISFNKADLAYAKALDETLRAAGFTTFFYPNDLGAGGNIPIWMDDALMNSAQTLAQQLLSEDAVTVVASDGHNSKARPPVLKEAFLKVANDFGEDRARRLMLHTPACIVASQFQFQFTAKAPAV